MVDVLEIPDSKARGDVGPNAKLTHSTSLSLSEELSTDRFGRYNGSEFKCYANPTPCYAPDSQPFAARQLLADDPAHAIIRITVRGVDHQHDILVRRKEMIDAVDARIAKADYIGFVPWDKWFGTSGVGKIHTIRRPRDMAMATANYGQRIVSLTRAGVLSLKDFNQYEVKGSLAKYRQVLARVNYGQRLALMTCAGVRNIQDFNHSDDGAHLRVCVNGCGGRLYTSYTSILRTLRERESLPFTETMISLGDTYQRMFMDDEHLVCVQTDEVGLVRKIDIFSA